MDRRPVLWWATLVVAYPLLLAVCLVTAFAVFALATPLDMLTDTTSQLVFAGMFTAVVFAAAVGLARRSGAPAKSWLIPAAGFVIYVAYAAITFRGDPPTESAPPSLVIISLSAVLFSAVLGTIGGDILHSRSRRLKALTEQALQPDASVSIH